MPTRIRYSIYGRLVDIEGGPGGWKAFAVGDDGKRRHAGFVVPDFLEAHELGQYLFDLFHEAATPTNGDIVQLSARAMGSTPTDVSATNTASSPDADPCVSRASFCLVDYDARWPGEFNLRRTELVRIFEGADVRVEHIGSTSIPGLCAKPVIDILLGAASLAEIEQRVAPLRAAGYAYRPEHEDVLPMRRYFVRPESERLRVHLHAVCVGAPIWLEHLVFRDALRGDADLRAQYGELKRALYDRHSSDRAAYTAAKAPFIQRVLAQAQPRRANVEPSGNDLIHRSRSI